MSISPFCDFRSLTFGRWGYRPYILESSFQEQHSRRRLGHFTFWISLSLIRRDRRLRPNGLSSVLDRSWH